MPVITIQISNMTTEKKRELISRMTDTAADVTGIPAASFVMFVDEHAPESIGVGGQTLADKRIVK